jgi:hypothetical protein
MGTETLPPSDAETKVSEDSPWAQGIPAYWLRDQQMLCWEVRWFATWVDGIGNGALKARGDPYARPRIKNARWIMLMVGLPPNRQFETERDSALLIDHMCLFQFSRQHY